MKIGIIGAGNLGTGIGKRLVATGHDVVLSFARSPERVAEAARRIGAKPGSTEDAARHGDVVVVATPWAVTIAAITPLRDALAGKILWDTTNPFAPSMDELLIGTTTSAGEQVAAAVPGARVVKAVPPFAELLHADSTQVDGRKPGTFVCSDDAEARRIVAGLVADIDSDPAEAGPLKLARFTEPAGMLVTNLAYVQGYGGRSGLSLLREASAGETIIKVGGSAKTGSGPYRRGDLHGTQA